MLTVAELIEALQGFDPNAPVHVSLHYECSADADKLEIADVSGSYAAQINIIAWARFRPRLFLRE